MFACYAHEWWHDRSADGYAAAAHFTPVRMRKQLAGRAQDLVGRSSIVAAELVAFVRTRCLPVSTPMPNMEGVAL